MSGQEKKKYESPATKKTQVEMEEGFLKGSKQPVVANDKNTTVEIERQGAGGNFELDTWNE